MFSEIDLCRDDDWKVIELFEKKDSIKRENINGVSKKSKEIHKGKKQRSFGHEKRPLEALEKCKESFTEFS
jgi:hypothetical protein